MLVFPLFLTFYTLFFNFHDRTVRFSRESLVSEVRNTKYTRFRVGNKRYIGFIFLRASKINVRIEEVSTGVSSMDNA